MTGLRSARAGPTRIWTPFTVVDTSTSEPVELVAEFDPAWPASALDEAVTSALAARRGGLWLDGVRLTGPLRLSGLRAGSILGLGGPLTAPALRPAVEVVAGSGAGTVHPLHAELELGDVLLHPGPAGVVATDREGTTSVLRPGELLDLGDRVLMLTDAPHAPGTRGLHTDVTRPPRLRPSATVTSLRMPELAEDPQARPLPLVPLLLPLALGAAMAVVSSPLFLLFALLSPMTAFSSWWSERRRTRRMRDRLHAVHTAAVADLTTAEEALRRAEAAARVDSSPDPTALRTLIDSPRLWERRRGDDDFLVLRIGTGEATPSSYRFEGGSPAPLAGVPVTVPLREVGVLGVLSRATARWLVAQAAVLHGPRDLSIWLLVDPSREPSEPDWSWLRWLPHTVDERSARVGNSVESLALGITELTALLTERSAAAGDVRAQLHARRLPDVLVVLDGARGLRSVAGVAGLLQAGPPVGIYVVCVDESDLSLPEECQAVVTGDELRRQACEPRLCLLDAPPVSWASDVARALAPLRDAGTEGGVELPTSARLLDLLGLDPPTQEGVRARWGRTAAAVIGVDAEGPVVLDLQSHGPHVLVAGTTGSGKSELLQTLVASLAVANRPDAMTFVLVDYKGGAAFRDCARLPHTVGMVTDLDGHLVERALTSLSAELRRRERLLDAASVKDIEDLWASGGDLPRLVIVVDEFATLVEELPDFVRGLVGIAQRGRSLGVHLVLATQRPSGVVSPEIRANTNLRIALRVTTATESLDVLDAPDAAGIPISVPGRAIARSDRLFAFQAARVAGRRPGTGSARHSQPCSQLHPRVHLNEVPWAEVGLPFRPGEGVRDDESTDLADLVDAMRLAVRGTVRAGSPWLDPLPTALTTTELAAARPLVLPYALEDLPAEQRRGTAALDLMTGGHLLVVGTARSGRTTLLRTLARSLVAGTSPSDVHLYAIDAGAGALAELTELPHTGVVASRQQADRVDRLLNRLALEVARRHELLAAAGWADLAEQRAASDEPLPYLLLFLDRWEGFTAAFEDLDAGRLPELLLRLLREGLSAGLRVVVTGDRTALIGRLSQAIEEKVVLRLAERSDYALAGLAPRDVPHVVVDGRGFRAGVELQVARPAPLPRDGALLPGPRAVPPFRIDPLPTRMTWAEARALPREEGIGVGVGGDELALIGIDLAVHGPGFTVAGPPRSGRSTALVGIATSLLTARSTVCALTPRRSPLRDVPGVVHVAGADALVPLLNDTRGSLVVIVDDAEALVDDPVAEVLMQVLCDGKDLGHGLVVAGNVEELAATFRGFVREARKSRSGLLLGLTNHLDGELLGVRLPRSAAAPGPAGRGVLVRNGQARPVHVPL